MGVVACEGRKYDSFTPTPAERGFADAVYWDGSGNRHVVLKRDVVALELEEELWERIVKITNKIKDWSANPLCTSPGVTLDARNSVGGYT